VDSFLAKSPLMFHPLRRLYDWVLGLSKSRYAVWALFGLAFAEATFFPIPPDVLLIALALSLPARSFFYAFICTVGSVAGGVVGYGIGTYLMQSVGCPIVTLYHGEKIFDQIATVFNAHSFWAIFVAAITPIPYKVFTIAAGLFHINFVVFIAASILGRGIRFFSIGYILKIYGEKIADILYTYFNIFSLIVLIVVTAIVYILL